MRIFNNLVIVNIQKPTWKCIFNPLKSHNSSKVLHTIVQKVMNDMQETFVI